MLFVIDHPARILPTQTMFARDPGRWAFVRPMRRSIVALSTLGRWALDYPGTLARATPPLDEELYSATVLGAAPSVVKGDLGRGGKVPSSPPLEGWAKPGVVRDCGIIHLVPLSSRAKRGDPVNKKALRANARRHIALDCHSRTTTFSTFRAPSQ